MSWVIVIFVFTILLMGCSSTMISDVESDPLERAEVEIGRGNWMTAFDWLEDVVNTEENGDPLKLQKAKELVAKYPRLLVEGNNLASVYAELPGAKVAINNESSLLRRMINATEVLGDVEILNDIRVLVDTQEERRLEREKRRQGAEEIRLASASFGRIIDVQMQNLSKGATTGGAALGQAIGSATYVDQAFSGGWQSWDYSAKGHLAASLVGALIGSTLDQAATSLWRTRYTIRTTGGETRVREEVNSSSFHHAVGVCVAVFGTSIEVVNDSRCVRNGEE